VVVAARNESSGDGFGSIDLSSLADSWRTIFAMTKKMPSRPSFMRCERAKSAKIDLEEFVRHSFSEAHSEET
jgi:hypothetical protein